MTIRVVSLGGTDFTFGEKPLASADLNDTFNEVQRIIENTSTGHDHDGTDSKQIKDMDASGSTVTFDTSSGHDHDGTSAAHIQGDTLIATGSGETSDGVQTIFTESISSGTFVTGDWIRIEALLANSGADTEGGETRITIGSTSVVAVNATLANTQKQHVIIDVASAEDDTDLIVIGITVNHQNSTSPTTIKGGNSGFVNESAGADWIEGAFNITLDLDAAPTSTANFKFVYKIYRCKA